MSPLARFCGTWPDGGVPTTRHTTTLQKSGAMPDAVSWAAQGPESSGLSIGRRSNAGRLVMLKASRGVQDGDRDGREQRRHPV